MFDVPIYVISCPIDQDRRDLTKSRLEEQNLSFKWFDAIDGYQKDEAFFRQHNIWMEGEPGSNGCALSHKLLWQKIVDNKIPSCIIMEDDVVFHEEFQQLAPLYWKISDKNSMIFMGHCALHGEPGKMNVIEGLPYGLQAYYITYDIAKWFLDHFDFCKDHIDIHMRNLYYGIRHEWKSFGWWDGRRRSKYHQITRLSVVFNGLILQDHDMRNSITRKLEDK